MKGKNKLLRVIHSLFVYTYQSKALFHSFCRCKRHEDSLVIPLFLFSTKDKQNFKCSFTFLEAALSLRCKCRSIFDCLQSFLTVSLYTVLEASLELCSLLTLVRFARNNYRRTLGMIHHSFHIDSFSNFFSVLISPKIFVYPVNRLNILTSGNRFMSSLKAL